jgi:hypothetical protein
MQETMVQTTTTRLALNRTLRLILFQLAAAIFGVPAAQAANAVTDCPHTSGQPKNILGGKQP